MTYCFTIPGRLPGFNDLKASSKYWWKAAKAKKAGIALVCSYGLQAKLPKFQRPVVISISCVERDGRRDRDNVSAGAAKVILDGLQQIGVIQNDSRKWVDDIKQDTKRIDKNNPRVEIEITEVI